MSNTQTLTVDGATQSIILPAGQPKITLKPGVYSVSLQSTLCFSGDQLRCLQAILMNMNPLQNNYPLGWYQVINVLEPIVLSITQTSDVYVVILDTVTQADNTGQVSVNFHLV